MAMEMQEPETPKKAYAEYADRDWKKNPPRTRLEHLAYEAHYVLPSRHGKDKDGNHYWP